ncbi:MAG TPA: cupin-like domain-containing protein [Cellvibrionaceae bacterium]
MTDSVDFPMISVREWHHLNAQEKNSVMASAVPIIVRGYVKHWPLVKAASQSFATLRDYLLAFDKQSVFQAMVAPPEVAGRLGYTEDMSAVNFERMPGRLQDALNILVALQQRSSPPDFYIGSSAIKDYLPGLEKENTLPCLDESIASNIWLGSAVTVATHNDHAENIACVAAGSRCFTLFPPEEEENLYIGPEDMTPAGRPISLVDLYNPDFQRFPRFRRALQQAQVAQLEAGDALYIPTHWWHHVQSQAPVNILVNYWWNGAPPALG